MTQFDIAIIGGGASGLAAAIAAARFGAAVAILEKLPRVGKKILATGNGRCNLGNLSRDLDTYGGSVEIAPVFAQFPGEADFFRSLGVWVRPDEVGRLYPASYQAASVLDALRLECTRLGVVEICDFAVREIKQSAGRFILISSADQSVTAQRVILAAGGAAGAQFGTSGDGARLARDLGHQVTDCYPALAPIPVEAQGVRGLKGIRVQAEVTALRDGQIVGREAGQVQFADGALTGICVFNLAHLRPDILILDLLPWCEDVQGLLAEIINHRAEAALEDLLTGLFPKRIGQVLIKVCTDQPLTAPVSVLKKGEITALGELMKDWRFPACPADNWDTAQVTAGGVTEVLPTLESSTIPGLFFAGEVLDVHGDCGGFNLRWAWASGSVAGEHAARGLGL